MVQNLIRMYYTIPTLNCIQKKDLHMCEGLKSTKAEEAVRAALKTLAQGGGRKPAKGRF